MAKQAWFERNKKKAETVKKYAALRAELKAKRDYAALSKLPRNASPTRLVNRCAMSGRRHGYLRKFACSRLTFREAALLDDSEMLAAVTALNHQIVELAPVLNSPPIPDAAGVRSENADVSIALMVKQREGATYLFAVGMRDGTTTAPFTIEGIKEERKIEVLGENRTRIAKDGVFTDRFGPWDVHLYCLPAR